MMADVKDDREKFDWETAKRRMQHFERVVSNFDELSEDQVRQLLDHRAEQLARPAQEPGDYENCLEVIRFSMSDEQFAIETHFVREVYEADEITPLPGAPEHLVGLTNLRGEVLAIMDLRPFFGIGDRDIRERPRVIVIGTNKNELGIVATAIDEVAMVEKDKVKASSGTAMGPSRGLLHGVTQQAVMVINGGALLADERLFIGEKDG